MYGAHLLVLALQKPGQKNAFTLVRPTGGWGEAVGPFKFTFLSTAPVCIAMRAVSTGP
jgi:hypothetical protein